MAQSMKVSGLIAQKRALVLFDMLMDLNIQEISKMTFPMALERRCLVMALGIKVSLWQGCFQARANTDGQTAANMKVYGKIMK
jgi:hypothetical protein